MKTLEIDGVKVRVQIWWVGVAPSHHAAPPVCVCRWVCSSVQGHGGSGTIPDHHQTVLQACTGDLGTHTLSRMVGLFSNVPPCAGHHLCLRHHKPAVLPAPRQVGQWCGRSEPPLINSALSGALERICDAFLRFCRALPTSFRGSWWETNVMRNSGGRWQKTKEARFETRGLDCLQLGNIRL